MKAVTLEYIESKLQDIQNTYPESVVEISKFKDGYGIGLIFNGTNDEAIPELIEGIPVLFVYYE